MHARAVGEPFRRTRITMPVQMNFMIEKRFQDAENVPGRLVFAEIVIIRADRKNLHGDRHALPLNCGNCAASHAAGIVWILQGRPGGAERVLTPLTISVLFSLHYFCHSAML